MSQFSPLLSSTFFFPSLSETKPTNPNCQDRHSTSFNMPSRPFPPNPNSPISRPSSFLTKTKVMFLILTISAFLVLLASILYLLYHLWQSLVPRAKTIPFDSTAPLKLERFSYKELKNATNEFDAANIIGKGGSGTVFRGILRNGKLIAVKRLDALSLQTEREFQNELQILGGLRSPFLVTLLGYCAEKSNRILVYEYMPNKSLQESLFGDGLFSLSWERRFEIILDIAKALEFLHLGCDPPVIHGDIKPSNVLLDFDYRPKISDFGLSRIKVEGEFGVDLFSQDLGKSQDLWKSQDLGLSSNVLLDFDYRPKISDFGLSRIKLEGEFGVDLFSQDLGKSQDLWKSQDLSGNLAMETPAIGTPVESDTQEVDFALALQASSSSKNSRTCYNIKALNLNSANYNADIASEGDFKNVNSKGKKVSTVDLSGYDWNNRFVSYYDDPSSLEHSKELNSNACSVVDEPMDSKLWGKDWWWKQGSDELCSKDYVMEWIESQIFPSTNLDWDEEKKSTFPEKNHMDESPTPDKVEDAKESNLQELRFGDSHKEFEMKESKGRKKRKKKPRKMQEWWKEEHLDEISKKGSYKLKNLEKKWKRGIKMPHFDLGRLFYFRRRKKFAESSQNECDQNGEFSFRRGWKKKNTRSIGSDMWSGDLFSRELSSTTSMRGTLCYVAPEYGGCGYLMEKADIYSFGVLVLVIVSGRRPLHVLASPMKLEKANLISWCRQLALSGNILELVDEKLKDEYNKDQASLCINLALTCLQKMSELRPDIGDIVKIFKGEMELPPVPFELSPSPPSKPYSKSRKKHTTNAE